MNIIERQSPSDVYNSGPDEPGYRGLLVIIPSRNRSDLATRAIRSTLDAGREDRVSVLVSDNSTDPAEIAALSDFCRGLKDGRVHYIRPPEPMKMATHWDWVFRVALEKFDVSHLTLLADRRIYRRGGLHELCDLTRRHPDSVIVTHSDTCYDDVRPIKLERKTCSGRLLRVRSEDLLKGNALAILEVMVLVPVPFTSIIPRRLFGQVRERFGDYCLSLAPDYCFGYRVLDLEDSVLLYDKSMSLMLGTGRSNGMALMRGTTTKDKADFIATNGGEEFRYWTTPVPEILSGINGIFHEYNFIRDQAQSGRFPELDLQGYLANLHSEITNYFENAELKARYLGLLTSRGFRGPEPASPTGGPQPRRSIARRLSEFRGREPDKPLWKLLPERLARKVSWTSSRLTHNRPIGKIWRGLHRVAKVPLPAWIEGLGFASVEEAVEYFNGNKPRPSNDLERVLRVEVETA